MLSERASLLSRMCTALIIALGFAVAFAFAIVLLNQIGSGFFRAPTGDSYENLFIDADGNVLVSTYTYRDRRWEYRTLDSRPVVVDAQSAQISGAYLSFGKSPYAAGPQPGWEGRVFPFADDAVPPTYWYFVLSDAASDGRGYFAGYNAETQLPAGFLGTQGFTSTRPGREEQFPVFGPGLRYIGTLFSSWGHQHTGGMSPAGPAKFSSDFGYPPWIVYLHSGHEFLKIDLSRRTVAPLLNADDIISVGQISRPETSPPAGRTYPRSSQTYALRRADRITVFNPANESTEDFRLPDELRERNFTFYSLPNHTALIDAWYWDGRTRPGDHDLVWLDADGAISRKEQITLNQRTSYPSSLEVTIVSAICIPGPLVGSLLFVGENAQDSFVNAIGNQWLRTLLVLLASAAAAAIAAWKQRRSGRPRSYVWVAFVFLLGFPGLVGYLLHRRWPVRQAVPAPQRTGIEVFG